MGLEKERVYDRQLDHQRRTAGINDDDYYEYHLHGRIYVLSDAADARRVLAGQEVPLAITRIAAGLRGETMVFGVPQAERNKTTGFGAVELYERRRKAADDFYAEIYRNGVYYVFGSGAALDDFRNTGRFQAQGAGSADRHMAVFNGDSDAARARFAALREPAPPSVPPGCVCESQ